MAATLTQMWEQVDRDRMDASSMANLAMARRAQARAAGDAQAFEIFDLAARRHRTRAMRLLAVQTLIGHVETSETIRAELARLAAQEKAAAAADREDDNGEE